MARPIGTGGQAAELTPHDIDRVLAVLAGTRHPARNIALFQVGLGTGLRIAEIVSLTVGDVRGRSGEVLTVFRLDRTRTKSKRSRSVAVSAQAREALAAHLAELAAGGRLLGPDDPVFPSQVGGPERPMAVRHAARILDLAFKAAGVAHASTHSMRRTHANALRRAGVDLKIIQDQLGHSSLAITERYLSVDPREKQRAVEGLRF